MKFALNVVLDAICKQGSFQDFKITGVFTNGWPIFGLQKASFARKTQINLQEKASIFACVTHLSLHEL